MTCRKSKIAPVTVAKIASVFDEVVNLGLFLILTTSHLRGNKEVPLGVVFLWGAFTAFYHFRRKAAWMKFPDTHEGKDHYLSLLMRYRNFWFTYIPFCSVFALVFVAPANRTQAMCYLSYMGMILGLLRKAIHDFVLSRLQEELSSQKG